MSEKIILEAETREISGKKVKQLRREGLVPAVIYGLGEPESIQVNALKTMLTLRDSGENDILTLNLNGKERRVLAREVQRHVYRPDLLHVDFLEIDADSVVRGSVEIVLEGKSIPEQKGLGTTLQVISTIDIEAKSGALISSIVANAEIIDKPSRNLLVSDIVVPEGVTILTPSDLTIARFAVNRKVEVVEDDPNVVEVSEEEDEE